jgi:hypothetical protein
VEALILLRLLFLQPVLHEAAEIVALEKIPYRTFGSALSNKNWDTTIARLLMLLLNPIL